MPDRVFKFLVVADGSPEARLACYFAARRAKSIGGRVTLLAVIQPVDFHHWLGVGAEIQREERETAEATLRGLAEEVLHETGDAPEFAVREGDLRNELRHVIEHDHDIRILVLGAGPAGEPGPLVQSLVKGGRGLFGARALPVVVIPASMSREEIRALV